MLFEFQTQVARLFGCEVANASMYDGSTAMWEAIDHGATAFSDRTRRSSRRACTRIMSASPRPWRSSPKTELETALPAPRMQQTGIPGRLIAEHRWRDQRTSSFNDPIFSVGSRT